MLKKTATNQETKKKIFNYEEVPLMKQTPMVKKYKAVANKKTGALELKPDGEVNIDIEINQHVAGTDYKKQIVVDPVDGRFRHIAAEERKAEMIDTTAFPKTPAELKELEIKTISKVERLNLAREKLAKNMELLQEENAARSKASDQEKKSVAKTEEKENK